MDRLNELKIRMLMKLKKLTRKAAVAEIARMDENRRKAGAEKARAKECRESTPNIGRRFPDDGGWNEEMVMSADEFFGGL